VQIFVGPLSVVAIFGFRVSTSRGSPPRIMGTGPPLTCRTFLGCFVGFVPFFVFKIGVVALQICTFRIGGAFLTPSTSPTPPATLRRDLRFFPLRPVDDLLTANFDRSDLVTNLVADFELVFAMRGAAWLLDRSVCLMDGDVFHGQAFNSKKSIFPHDSAPPAAASAATRGRRAFFAQRLAARLEVATAVGVVAVLG
jgi:hypothetical protein